MNQKTRIALLSFWLGTMAFFSFVLAPAAFAVLPTQHLAGQVVSRTLGTAEMIGIVIGAVLLLLLLFARGRKSKIFFFELFNHPLKDANVKIVTTQVGIAVRGLHFNNIVTDFKN